MNNKKPPSVTNEPGTCFCPVIFGRAERINAIMFQCWSDSKDLDLVRFFTFLHIHNWHASATETWAPSFLLDNFSRTHTRTHTHTRGGGIRHVLYTLTRQYLVRAFSTGWIPGDFLLPLSEGIKAKKRNCHAKFGHGVCSVSEFYIVFP